MVVVVNNNISSIIKTQLVYMVISKTVNIMILFKIV